jgi:hypothetical protein
VVTDFTPLASTIGGMLIGISAVMLMLFNGRIAGISGILGRLFPPYDGADLGGAAAFVIGLFSSLLYSMRRLWAHPLPRPFRKRAAILHWFVGTVGWLGLIYSLVCDALPKRFVLRSTEVIRSAAMGPWSLALPSDLALLAFAMGLAEKPPL